MLSHARPAAPRVPHPSRDAAQATHHSLVLRATTDLGTAPAWTLTGRGLEATVRPLWAGVRPYADEQDPTNVVREFRDPAQFDDAYLKALLGSIEVVLHPNQPMVVDVLVELAEPGFATLTHPDDPGVRVARLDGSGAATSVHFRVRGLAPDQAHAMELGLGLVEGMPGPDAAAAAAAAPPPRGSGRGAVSAMTALWPTPRWWPSTAMPPASPDYSDARA